MITESMETAPPFGGGRRRVLSAEPPNAEAAEGAFAHLVTPAEQRFVRCHFPVPRLDAGHALHVHGAVAESRRFSLAGLRALPAVTCTVVTECAGNGRAGMHPPAPGEQWTSGAVSVAQWTGVPLRSLLHLRESAVEVVFTGADGGRYRRSLPAEVAMDGATLVAFEMNGEPIPAVFGGPLRLIVPGWYGMASVKWLSRVEAVETPFEGEFQTERYVYAPGEPVTRVKVKSMFTDLPRRVSARAPLRVTGLCWGGAGIARVQVSDGGEWQEARLVGPILAHAWRRFELRWTPPAPGTYRMKCRAADASGDWQPDAPPWNEQGYGVNGVEEIEIVAC
ncbi:MAG TPA: molybdopterin-dependent oxidoreductase [Myxococcales bacterium]|nr:molybdopterin-dependent oxidoreductase [Myxococcales bacterium]